MPVIQLPFQEEASDIKRLHLFIPNVDFPIYHNPNYIWEIDIQDYDVDATPKGCIPGPDQGDLVKIGNCSIWEIDAREIDGLGLYQSGN